MKNILITGGSGYIGSVLVEKLLTNNYNVTVIDNLIYQQKNLFHLCHYNNFNFIKSDIRNKNITKEQLDKNDIIIHLAALVGAPICQINPTDAVDINLNSTKFICQNKSKDQLLIFPTTNSGYGTTTFETICTEETPLNPISLYGTTKAEAEKYILEKNGISFRLATVFGASSRMRMDLLVNDFVYKALVDKYIVLFEKKFRRNFVYIRDVADCFIFAINNYEKIQGNVFNLGNDDENLTKEDLALKIKEYIPQLEIYESKNGSDPDKRDYVVSSKKLKNIGFEAKIPLNIGIKELVKTYKILGQVSLGNL